MKTIIRATKEHREALDKLSESFTKLSKSYDKSEMAQCRVIIDEAFKTLERLADENKLYETIDVMNGQEIPRIKIGDTVKMVNCFEAEKYAGQVFTVTTEPYQISGTWCVGLEGRRGGFDIACLEKCEVDGQ